MWLLPVLGMFCSIDYPLGERGNGTTSSQHTGPMHTLGTYLTLSSRRDRNGTVRDRQTAEC